MVGGSPPTVAGVCVLEVGGTVFTERGLCGGSPAASKGYQVLSEGNPEFTQNTMRVVYDVLAQLWCGLEIKYI